MSAQAPNSHILESNLEDPQIQQLRQPPSSRPKETSKATKKKKKNKKRKKLTLTSTRKKSQNKREGENDWFEIQDIIDEKLERGKLYYLVDWKGTDETGKPHEPSWVPKQNLTSLAIQEWEVRKATSKPTKDKADVAVGDSHHSMSEFDTRQRDPVSTSSRDNQGYTKKRPLENQSSYDSKLGEGPPSKLPKLRLAETPSALHKSAGRDLELSKGPVAEPKPYKSRILIQLPRNPPFPADQYMPVPTDSQQTASQSSQSADAQAVLVHESETDSQDQRTVPDSQEIHSALISDVHSSIPDNLSLFGASQPRGQAIVASQQGGRPQDTEVLGHSTEIPSRQPDRPNVGNLGNVSTSTFLIGTVVGSTASEHSQGTIGRENPRFMTQERLDVDAVPPTSQPTSFASTQPHEFAWDEHISTTGASQDHNQEHLIGNNSQAAQVVQPLNSQQGGLATFTDATFTVYNDSVVHDPVRRNAQDEHNPQNSNQALSELDGNTRNTSFSEEHQSVLEPELSRGNLLQGPQEKEVDFEVEVHTTQPTSRQSAASRNMDSNQAPRLSARERLRIVRERELAALNSLPSFWEMSQAGASSENAGTTSASAAEPLAEVHEPQVIQAPASRDISPLTPVNLAPQSFLVPPLEPVANETSPDEHPLPVPETTEAPPEQEREVEPVLEEHGHIETGYSTHEEEQPATLDPSALTLSIEHDMDVGPPMPVHDDLHTNLQIPDEFALPHEEENHTPPDYPRSLLPYIPTGPNEYLVTLPFYNSCRPVYNDVLRDNEELIREYNASFRVYPHRIPHPAVLSKINEMFSRLFDICDLPPFMETTTTMTPAEITKHVVNTNAKFAFVAELLVYLADENSDKKILILSRPGKVMDFLGNLVETRGYRYIRSGLEIVGPSSAEHSLTVAVSSTLDNSSSIPEDIDVVIAFDHTYRPKVLPRRVREHAMLMVLTNICSIQHLNMRISENIEPLERKNVLVLALVRAMRYIEDVDNSLIVRFNLAAETFCKYIQDPDDDDFYWEPYEVPEDVFEDLHDASTQSQMSQTSQPGLEAPGPDQHPGSRKRSHEGEDDTDISSKRPRVSQPTVVTHVSHISDSLKGLIGDDPVDEPLKATLSVSVGKLENLSAKVTSLETKLRESREREKIFRRLSDRSKKEVDDYASTVNLMQEKYMAALKDRGTYEDQYYKAKEEALAASASLESKKREHNELKEKYAEQQKRLSAAHESLLESANPEVVKITRLEKELEEFKSKAQTFEKKVTLTNNELEYAKNAYQDASQRAAELQTENRALERRVEELNRKANENMVKVNQIHAESESRELLRLLNEQKVIVRDRDMELNRLRDELRMLRESRRGTRQSSVPRSPRLSAFGVNSPRNGGRAKGSSSSRGTSPAPATGIFEAGGGAGTPVHNNRASHLRESRF
ncbi:uncharacterized protein F4812DRAFT_457152 [Daldinia caldariorum]|uniref:uncharacterized protein n=1 Tax=Daldinia caldariorum TaxID=326644 RepID=UPI0020082BEF|nr:uncharacterized protein F4812DRAFT_457152 [Daldinia caldariorum]KAI1469751.1 hypothetical protein F4812DRAFT_457152 [Daldinia caldariorum]